MHQLKIEFMPEATQRNFSRLKDDPRMSGFTLVGGTALAIQIGHRVSEDLDFNVFGSRLPVRAIDGILDDLAAGGATIQSLITPEQKTTFRINSAESLDHYLQDYLIDDYEIRTVARLRP